MKTFLWAALVQCILPLSPNLCSPPWPAQTLVIAISCSNCASWPTPRTRPKSLGKPGHSTESFLPEHMAQSGSLPERHFASPLLIAIQSRQSSPQDLNAIFSLNYAESFREGGEII